MPRYFLELAYKGTAYKGFQVQDNANTIQGEVERALAILLKRAVQLTGSSRTDAGVHAWQNYFHFDVEGLLSEGILYNLNAILPPDISAVKLSAVPADAHCRFHALSRTYRYYIYDRKNPFQDDRAYFYPFKLDMANLQASAEIVKAYTDFSSFAKRNTQVFTHNCVIKHSFWTSENGMLVYEVTSNRFLRGMVKGLVGTMLRVGRGAISLNGFREIIEARDGSRADFSAPSHGLFLVSVNYDCNLL